MNVNEDFKLPVTRINAIANSIILAGVEMFCLLFATVQQGERSGLLGNAIMSNLSTLTRKYVGGIRMFGAWAIFFLGEKQLAEPVRSIRPYLERFPPVLYLMFTSLFA